MDRTPITLSASSKAALIDGDITHIARVMRLLLQGDLAEAWREGDDEYATVAMRYQLTDTLIDRNSGRVVEMGNGPDQGTEYWTFRRARGAPWMVSAIQQAA